MRHLVGAWLLIFCVVGFTAAGQGTSTLDANGQLVDPALQTRFETITKDLRCLVCQNESVADSNAQLAGDLRRQVREMLVAGKSDDDVFKFMTDRYGDFVRFNPPLEPKTLLIWGAPFITLAVGRLHRGANRAATCAHADRRMTTFIVVAALMAAIAAATVAVPLLRSKRSRLLGILTAVLIAGAAAGLYPLWSNWNWHAPAEANAAQSPDVLAMVGKLEQHLKEQPDDREGWLMMGRSYMALERADDAVMAYQHAYDLGKGADATLGLAEALSVRAGGEITPQAGKLFEEALKQAPDDPKALFYGGFAAAIRGDRGLARERWQTLKDLHPPKQIEDMLDARIAELGPETSPTSSAGTTPSTAGTNATATDSRAAQVDVKITVAPALKARVTGGTPVVRFRA